MRACLFAFVPLAVVVACSSSSSTETPKNEAPKPVPALTGVKTTVDETIAPKKARQSYTAGPNPGNPDALDTYLAQGFGDTQVAAGQKYTTRVIDGSTPPAAGAAAKRVARFVHIPDFQIADDESPTRLASFDASSSTDAAMRPQDAYLCSMANAAVRTINALHAKDPIGFVLLGGDNADSAQGNEVSWVLDILSGADKVECDSGSDDDLVPGASNDGKDPFKADGLKMPWKWVTGNHDVLVQGNVAVNESRKTEVLGTRSGGGTRNYAGGSRGAVERGDFVIADPRRALLDRKELMNKVASHGDGHGLGDAQKQSGKAIYTFDVDGAPIRFLVLDTGCETGGADGMIHQADVDSTIKPALDKAKADGKWVILASHHSSASLTDDGGAFGVPQADAVLQDKWEAFIGSYPNVVFSMVGHSHQHRVRTVAPPGGHSFWEVMTSSIADFPNQFRVVEIFDQDNGWIMLRATCVDYSSEGDAIAAEGRRRAVTDFTSGWTPGDGPGKDDERNVELWIKKP